MEYNSNTAQTAVRLQSRGAQVILNHFRLIPPKAEAWLSDSRHPGRLGGGDWKPHSVCAHHPSHTHYPQFCLSVVWGKKKHILSLTSNAHKLPTVSLTSHSRRQQLTPSPLSPPLLSPTHTHTHTTPQDKTTDNDLPSHHPTRFFHCSDKKWLASIISKTGSPADLLSPFEPSLRWSLWKRLNVVLKPHFLLNSASLHQNPTQTRVHMLGFV